MKGDAPARWPILILFFLSGATGLVYEVVWTRYFSIAFGSTALAVSSVLAAFMAGLALGSWIIGKRIDRGGEELRIYGLLEIGIALFALLFLPAIDGIGTLFVKIHRAFEPSFHTMSLLRFGFAFLLLIVPTALMGGTLPVLVRYWVRARGEVGRTMGNLYAINTLGAMIGCFAAGFLLIATFGCQRTVFATAAANLTIGVIALSLGLRRRRREMPREPLAGERDSASELPAGDVASRSRIRLALAAIGISGFLALAYEVVWTRVLLYVLSASVYAFSIMLTTFLGGLALGSLVLSRRVDRMRSGFRLFGILEVLIGGAALLSVALLSRFTEIHDALLVLFRVESWNTLAAVKYVEALLVVFVPTLLMGMIFPLVTSLYVRNLEDIGTRVGRIVAVNTVGAVLGSFSAGFLLIPLLGTQNTIVLLAVLNGLLGGVLLVGDVPHGAARRSVLLAAPPLILFALSLLLPERAFLPVFGINLRGGEIVYCREGISGTVTIHDSPGSRLLSINGADVAGTSRMLRTTQKLQAHIPLLLHPDPQLVMQVGLGSGETAHSLLLHPIERLVGVDIAPEVIEAGAHFGEINRGVYANPRLEIVIEDAKNYVAYADEAFDLILNDSVHPLFRGSSDLYARDYFEQCRDRLAPGGMMSSWFPTGLLLEPDLKMLLRTFQEVFPQCTVWIGTNCITRNALLLGWKEAAAAITIDFGRIASRLDELPAVRADLAEVQLGTAYELVDCFMLDADAIREYTRDARINSYDRPHMEFSAPRALASGDRAVWANNLQAMFARRVPVLEKLVGLGEDERDRSRVLERLALRRAASEHVLQGIVHELRMEGQLAQAEYRRALEVYPEDPVAGFLVEQGEEFLTRLESAVAAGVQDTEVYYELARIYREQGRSEEAARLLERTVQLKPDHVRAHLDLAGLRIRRGDSEGAWESVDRALELDPRLAAGYALRGQLKANAGDFGGAEADLLRAEEKGTALPWALSMLGDLLWRQGRTGEAIKRYRSAVELNPDLASAQRGLGLALIASGQDEEAIPWLERVLAARESPDLRLELGGARKRLGFVAEAIEDYRAACEADPGFAEAHNRLAFALSEVEGRSEEALAAAQRAIALEEGDGYYLDTLGWVQFRGGLVEEAEATLTRSLAALAEDDREARAVVLHHRAQARAELGHTAAAVEDLRKALELWPDFPDADSARRQLSELR